MRDSVLDWEQPIERYFEEIFQIPRNSGCEKEISDYIVEFARKLWIGTVICSERF